MLKNSRFLSFALALFVSASASAGETDGCYGNNPNPLSDICWDCIFPISIGPIKIEGENNWQDNGDDPPLVCGCPAPPPVYYRIGVGISYWEPYRVAEIVRPQMCSPFLGGDTLGSGSSSPRGSHSGQSGSQDTAFYHVHWYTYPVLSWVAEELVESLCQKDSDSFDLVYMTEWDATWSNDDLGRTLNPDAVLFTSLPAQAACAYDSAVAAATNFGVDSMIWCSGSQGSVYPLSGTTSHHVGGVDSSILMIHRLLMRLHREMLADDTSTSSAICEDQKQMIMRKGQYKHHMLYPVPQTKKCFGFGVPSSVWASGREYPYKGEDFVHLVWRKRICCAG